MYTVHKIGYGNADLGNDTYNDPSATNPFPFPFLIAASGVTYIYVGWQATFSNVQSGQIIAPTIYNILQLPSVDPHLFATNASQNAIAELNLQDALQRLLEKGYNFTVTDLVNINIYYDGVEGGPVVRVWAKDTKGNFLFPPADPSGFGPPPLQDAYNPLSQVYFTVYPNPKFEIEFPITVPLAADYAWSDTYERDCQDNQLPPYWTVVTETGDEPDALFVANDHIGLYSEYVFDHWETLYQTQYCQNDWVSPGPPSGSDKHVVAIPQNSYYWANAVYQSVVPPIPTLGSDMGKAYFMYGPDGDVIYVTLGPKGPVITYPGPAWPIAVPFSDRSVRVFALNQSGEASDIRMVLDNELQGADVAKLRRLGRLEKDERSRILSALAKLVGRRS